MGALMGLRPINPGPRTIHYVGNDVGKVSLVIPADDTLVVSDEVAKQLLAAATQFHDETTGLTDTEIEADKNAAEAREAIVAESGDELETADAKPNKRRKS